MRLSKFNVDAIRQNFPILRQEINGYPLVYLDNAATMQKPNVVIDAVSDFYRTCNSNVHRGAHTLSDRATEMFESARINIKNFIGANSTAEIVWTRGTTEAINIVASSWGKKNLKAGDRILVSAMEHHSNIVPWQMVGNEFGVNVEPIPVDENGTIDLDMFTALLDETVKLVAVAHVSNALGTINPIADIIKDAHAVGACVLIDAAQSIAHWPIDVKALDCDFLAFSGHKMCGPTGIGVLYGKQSLLEQMPPYQGGGEMIESVSFAGTHFNTLPYKFEAGTPNIAGAVGFSSAVDYFNAMDRVGAAAHEENLLQVAETKLQALGGFTVVGKSNQKTAILSFIMDGVHPQDVGMILDQQGVAVRTGNHCAQPIMDQFKLPGTVRASFSFYNTLDDVDRFIAALSKAKQFLL